LNREEILFLMILIVLFLPLTVYSWDKKELSGFLQPGKRVSSSILLVEDQISYSYTTFKIRVPENAFKMEIKIDNSPADLDIYMNYEREIDNYDDTEYFSAEDLFNESLSLSRLSLNPLYSGIYYFDIVYPLNNYPVVNDKELFSIPFGLTVKFTILEDSQQLEPDIPVRSSLSEKKGMMNLFTVDVPEEAETLRVDIFDTKSDLDMYLRYNSPALTFENADYIRESLLGQENIFINKDSVKSLRAGRYYISVFDRIEDSFTDDFSIIVSFSESAPEFLQQFPELPVPELEDLLEIALSATVEISTETSSGSGCIVSPDGYIITGLHVITDISGEIIEDVFVSMNLSNYYPPRELFKAQLIDIRKDEDLALLKIVSGYYGQPYPEKYKFPFYTLALNLPVFMGQPLMFLGYPTIGSEGSRASISLTRGIVSGFDSMDYGFLIKTDGEINSGNSGGAAFNEKYELIGFPMSVISSDGGQIAYIHPVSFIPDDWLRKFSK
jgi:hypothetical protein